jgi:hypothetical protein
LTLRTENHNPFSCTAFQQDANDRQGRNEALEFKILTMAGQMNAAQYRFIKMLLEFDEQGGWQGDCINSLAHWLYWKVGIGMVMGREKIRVARSLPGFPLIDAASHQEQ